MFDPVVLRQDFPILSKLVHGKSLVYLDNAATSQKPQVVIDSISQYYLRSNANVHRGVHHLSDESTRVWEESRRTIAQFFGADDEELIMVRNTTEAINGVVYGWGLDHLGSGDVVLCSEMEHHSNLVVWQEICIRTGARVEFMQVREDGRIDLEKMKQHIDTLRIKLVVLAHVSNALGTLNPVKEISQIVKKRHPLARCLVDGAQSAPHLPIDFHKLGVDFFTMSGHKMLGPMGSGALLVRKALLSAQEFRPWLFGGGMIEGVYLDRTTFSEELSERFTAGTPDVASAVGLAQACTYLKKLGMKEVAAHDRELVQYAVQRLAEIPEVKIVGPIPDSDDDFDRIGSVAFLYTGVHPHDVAQILDSEGVAVRSGHHCTMPLHTKFEWPGTVRLSFQVYNTTQDIDALITALGKVKKVFWGKE